jgi:hypothetical protein
MYNSPRFSWSKIQNSHRHKQISSTIPHLNPEKEARIRTTPSNGWSGKRGQSYSSLMSWQVWMFILVASDLLTLAWLAPFSFRRSFGRSLSHTRPPRLFGTWTSKDMWLTYLYSKPCWVFWTDLLIFLPSWAWIKKKLPGISLMMLTCSTRWSTSPIPRTAKPASWVFTSYCWVNQSIVTWTGSSSRQS